MKFVIYLSIVIVLLGVGACGWGTPISDATNKCVPPTYPDFTTVPMEGREVVTITTTDLMIDVYRAYMTELEAIEFPPDAPPNPIREARWQSTKYQDGYLFGCVELVSSYLIEGGCIYLEVQKQGTAIHRLWEVSEGLSGCSGALGISTGKEN